METLLLYSRYDGNNWLFCALAVAVYYLFRWGMGYYDRPDKRR